MNPDLLEIERALSFIAGLMLAMVAYGFMVPLWSSMN
jgi:hypothetical protein